AIAGRLEPVIGKSRVAFASESPLTPGGSTSSLTLPSPDGGPPVQVQASPRLVSPAFFSTLGLRIVAGRALLDSDTLTSPPVAVVNETFARLYLGKKPLEARIPMGVWGDQPGDAAIVGIVEDVRYGTTSTTLPEMYFAHAQIKEGMQSPLATLLVRIDDTSAGFAAAKARTAIREADAALVPGAIMTLE